MEASPSISITARPGRAKAAPTAAGARGHGARVVVEPRRGYGAAVHAGLEAASGELVAFLDGDGSLDADVLLTRPDGVPGVVADRADELAPRRVHGLGGQVALSRTTLRTFDQLRTPLTPIWLTPVMPDDAGGVVQFTVN